MKIKSLLAAVVVALPTVLCAEAPNKGYLLKADSMTTEGQRSVAVGNAAVIFEGGDSRITADRITYDYKAGVFTFAGAVKMHIAGATVETKEATLSVASGKRVFVLVNGAVTIGSGSTVDAGSGEITLSRGSFDQPFPRTETRLPAGK